MEIKIGLIDYGMGNLYSVQNAFERLGQSVEILKDSKKFDNFDSLILPGVGSFDPAMKSLEKTGMIPDIKQWGSNDKPLLGICLGLQLLFESSDEGSSQGLGILKGYVEKLPKGKIERIPHMGWSPLKQENKCPLFKKEDYLGWMYFVHSFSAIPNSRNDLAATTSFGDIEVTAVVWKGNIGACQFHPEKSGKAGQKLLFNWLQWLQMNKK